MATNPNNAFGTNAAFGGRTSPNAFNDVMGAFQSRGILSGWACSPDSGMSVVFGGDGTTRDVAIAEDNSGNKLSVNNIPGTPISVTIAAAPATQTRIDAVVAYIENPPQGTSTATDNYGAVNVLDVQGTASSTPVAPDDNAIRTAITADGASGSTAYYVVLAYITVASGTTDITSNLIEAGPSAELQTALTNIPANTITTAMIQSAAVTSNKIDWATITIGSAKLDYSTFGSTFVVNGNSAKTVTMDKNSIYFILCSIGTESAFAFSQSRDGLIYTNNIYTSGGMTALAYTNSGNDLTIWNNNSSSARIVVVKQLGNITW